MPFNVALFSIPIYLRTERDYNKDAAKAKEEAVQRAKRFNQQNHIIESFRWPPWEFNDIIGYLQIGIDVNGYLEFHVFGIPYERVPSDPITRRRHEMWEIDYKNYFDKDIIKDKKGKELNITDGEGHIKVSLSEFLRQMNEKTEKEGKYFDIDHWLLALECCNISLFASRKIKKIGLTTTTPN